MHQTLFVWWHQLRLLLFEFVLSLQFLGLHLTAPVGSNSAFNILCCAICCCTMRWFVSLSLWRFLSCLSLLKLSMHSYLVVSLIYYFLDFHVLLICLLYLFLPFVVSTGVDSSWRFHFLLFLVLLLSNVVLVAHYDASKILLFGSASCYLTSLLDSVLRCDHFICNTCSSP